MLRRQAGPDGRTGHRATDMVRLVLTRTFREHKRLYSNQLTR